MKTRPLHAAQARRYRWAVLWRVLLACLGGYAVTALACMVFAHVLVAVGLLARAPAVLLSTLLSFVLYTAVVLWVFHERRLRRVSALLLGSSAVLAGMVFALERWA